MHNHATEVTIGLGFLLGAIHALEPGHGKTAMFVYMLGGRRSIWHPIIMGVSTALSHSVSLFVIAMGVHLAHHVVAGDHHHEEQVSSVLKWISAALVMAVGGYLFLQAARGKRQRCCPHHQHDHADHAHAHSPKPHDDGLVHLAAPGQDRQAEIVEVSSLGASDSPAVTKAHGNYKTTALLGLAVGLLPCPSALAAYFTGLSSGSPTAAYLVIGIFAAGIACSLTVVGFVLQQFGDRLSTRMRHTSRIPWGYVRAVLILSVGLFYTSLLVLDRVT